MTLTVILNDTATQKLNVSDECVQFCTSEESKLTSLHDWKRLSKQERLRRHFQQIADDLSKQKNTKFSFE